VTVRLHPHAAQRLAERGATEVEVRATLEGGERFQAKFGRTGFRRDFPGGCLWRGRSFSTRQLEAYAVEEDEGWLVITVLVKYF
jgi:hypothetical protein